MKKAEPSDPHSGIKGYVSRRGKLVKKYALLISLLVAGVLAASGGGELYFSYQESKTALQRLQREKATSAALVIEQFVQGVEAQMGWTKHASFLDADAAMTQRRFDLLRLLRQAPEITEVAYVDAEGKEQLLVSRIASDRVASNRDYTDNPKFNVAQSEGTYISPVYFLQDSEPYLSFALRGQRRSSGVTIAEVNLKFVWDLISQMDVDRGGSAFVVDANGFLIAHREIALVLRKTDLSSLPQVALARSGAALSGRDVIGGVAQGIDGKEVLSSYATIAPLGWHVFVETPLSDAFAPLYDAMTRTAALICVGILLSIIAGYLLARRIVQPIQALQLGTSRIASGELDHQIAVSTGDELETLADAFNDMTVKLQTSYNNIERVSALKRYFSPHLADQIIASQDGELTGSHRREVTAVFCDLRNFTEFSSMAEPEEAMKVLEAYYIALGTQVREFEATIGFFAGDGLMAFLNDPLPIPDHALCATKMAVAMQHAMEELIQDWNKRGLGLGFGIGIATGYATLGHIGTEDQFHYTAIGSVVNLSSRLCDLAGNGEILITEAVYAQAEGAIDVAPAGEHVLKGFPKPVPVLKISRGVD